MIVQKKPARVTIEMSIEDAERLTDALYMMDLPDVPDILRVLRVLRSLRRLLNEAGL